MRDWAVKQAAGPHTTRWLGFFSFIEAIFFPVPPDVFLVGLVIADERPRWLRYAAVATICSALGGVIGYAIGLFFFDTAGQAIISFFDAKDAFERLGTFFADNAFISVFAAGFTPIPYKVFTIGAGFFKIDFLVFIAASVLSRGLRFFTVAYIMKVFGKDVGVFVFKYFNVLTGVLAVFIAAYVLVRFFV